MSQNRCAVVGCVETETILATAAKGGGLGYFCPKHYTGLLEKGLLSPKQNLSEFETEILAEFKSRSRHEVQS